VPDAKAGVYLNTTNNTVRRVGVGVNAPGEPEWVKVSDDPNLGLLAIREVAGERRLSPAATAIAWEY
jgi:hypothetical protein